MADSWTPEQEVDGLEIYLRHVVFLSKTNLLPEKLYPGSSGSIPICVKGILTDCRFRAPGSGKRAKYDTP